MLSTILQKLKLKLHFDTNIELSKALGFAHHATLSTNKRKNRIPYAEIVKLCQKEGIDLNWIFDVEVTK